MHLPKVAPNDPDFVATIPYDPFAQHEERGDLLTSAWLILAGMIAGSAITVAVMLVLR